MFSFNPEIVALALGSSKLSTWEWIAASDELRWTSGQEEIYGQPASEIRSLAVWESLIHQDDRERFRLAVPLALQTGTGFREQFRVEGRHGEAFWIFGYADVLRQSGVAVGLTGMNMDVTEWVERLTASETRFIATFEQAAVGMAHVSTDGRWLRVNQRLCSIVGYSKQELQQRTFSDITHPDDRSAGGLLMHSLLRGERSTCSVEKRYFSKDNHLVWINLTTSLVRSATGVPSYFISVIEDITTRKLLEAERMHLIETLEERVKARTAELEKMSSTDGLTGVANRRRFDEYIAAEWDRAVRARKPLSVVLIDIDYFKGLNDGLGHQAADRALIAVARQLARNPGRCADFAARYGGDEFVLVLPETDAQGAKKVAELTAQAVASLELRNPGSPISPNLTLSQGVATSRPGEKGSSHKLLLDADRALYQAKKAGRNCVRAAVIPRGAPSTQ